MARLPRLYAPGIVQHVVQRPLPERRLFHDGDDYALFTALLADAIRIHGVALHAYVLLADRIEFVATPPDREALSRLMQAIGRRFVPHRNRSEARAGPLWGGRYRSTLIDADRYLLAVMRQIERRPVTAGLVAEPGEWPWSSHGHHVGRGQQAFVQDHAAYWRLSDTPFTRQAAYGALAGEAVDPMLVARIDRCVEGGWALGDDAFLTALAATTNRRTLPRPRGRPKRPVPV